MKAPLLPSDEVLRLKELQHYNILGTLPEASFDDLTTLAARICDTPIALISLVDEHRQWFKSKVGLTVCETPRDISFCGHAILEPDLFIVPDALQDDRFSDNPLVTGDLKVRFYAGASLVTPSGRSLGALCVMDHAPRELSQHQQESLRILAHQVMSQLELRQQTRTLATSEERLRIVTENAEVGLVIVNRERNYVYANRTYVELLGLPSVNLIGQSVADVLAGIYEQQIRPRLDRAFHGERVAYELQNPNITGDRCYSVRYEPTSIGGEVEFVVVVLTDMTARKQTEQSLQESTRFAQATIDALSAHICVLDEQGTILTTNEAWRNFAKVNPSSVLSSLTKANYLSVCDAATGLGAEDAASFAAGIRAVICGEQTKFSMEYACHSSAEKRWFIGRVTRFPGAGPVRVVVAHEQITKRKLVEQANKRLAAIVESSHDAIIGKNLQGIVTSWNKGADKVFGYNSAEMVGTSILRLIPADRHDEERYILSTIGRGESVEHFETLRLRKDGTLIDISVTASPIRDATGQIIGVSKVARDITARKRAEAALRDSEERFRQLAENINVVFWITDPAKKQMLYVSPAYEKIWGRSCESLYASPQTWLEAIHPEDRERVRVAALARQVSGEYHETYRIIRNDGSLRWVHDQAFPIVGTKGRVHRIVGVAEDISARRNLEEQFRQAQKMEAIGQLAGGVAHDFNNILAAIIIQTELSAMEENLSAELQEGLRDIRKSAERAANLTRQLLLFSRKQVMHATELDLNEAVSSLVKMLKRIIGEHLSLQIHLHPGPLAVHADAGMLDQVLMNLVVNARDAMPDGGRILIETSIKTLTPETSALIPDTIAGDYFCVRVTDTGSGIPPEIAPRIFDPFFTTKAAGKGTGLGLATVFGIIKQHHGSITLESEVGKGTAFKIYLPAVIETVKPSEKPNVSPKPRGGTETILLVEDDESIRALTRIVLERAGYTVLDACDGPQAVELAAKHQTTIRLLLTDMVMPGNLNGRELAAQLQAQIPNLRVIITSGYSADMAGRDIALDAGQKFIQKPAPPHVLLEAVRTSLDN